MFFIAAEIGAFLLMEETAWCRLCNRSQAEYDMPMCLKKKRSQQSSFSG